MQSKQTLLEVQHLPNFPRLILSVLTEDGYDEDELLKGLDLSPKQLADETFRLSANQHEKFILRVLTITNDLHLALRISEKVDIATSSLAIMAVINSGRISRALSLFSDMDDCSRAHSTLSRLRRMVRLRLIWSRPSKTIRFSILRSRPMLCFLIACFLIP